ncbi:MAG: hypothetical protein AB7F64_06430 [Gammaproteobacteria bacterium]
MFEFIPKASIHLKPASDQENQIGILRNQMLKTPYIYYYPFFILKALMKIHNDPLNSDVKLRLADLNNQLHILAFRVNDKQTEVYIDLQICNQYGVAIQVNDENPETKKTLRFAASEFSEVLLASANPYRAAARFLASSRQINELPFHLDAIPYSRHLIAGIISIIDYSVRNQGLESFSHETEIKNFCQQMSQYSSSNHWFISILLNAKRGRPDLNQIIDEGIKQLLNSSMASELDALSVSLLTFKSGITKSDHSVLTLIDAIEQDIKLVGMGQLSRIEFLKKLRAIELSLYSKPKESSSSFINLLIGNKNGQDSRAAFSLVLSQVIEKYREALSANFQAIISHLFIQKAITPESGRNAAFIKYYNLFKPVEITCDVACYFAFLTEPFNTFEAWELVLAEDALDFYQSFVIRCIDYLKWVTYQLICSDPNAQGLFSLEKLLLAKQQLIDAGFPIHLPNSRIEEHILQIVMEQYDVSAFNRLQKLPDYMTLTEAKRTKFVRSLLESFFERAQYEKIIEIFRLNSNNEVFGVENSRFELIESDCRSFFITALFARLNQLVKQIVANEQPKEGFIDCFYESSHLYHLWILKTGATKIAPMVQVKTNVDYEQEAVKMLQNSKLPMLEIFKNFAQLSSNKLSDKSVFYGNMEHNYVVSRILENLNPNMPLLLCALYSSNEIVEFKAYLMMLNELANLVKHQQLSEVHFTLLVSDPNLTYAEFLRSNSSQLPSIKNSFINQLDGKTVVAMATAAKIILESGASDILYDLFNVINYVENYIRSLSNPAQRPNKDFLSDYKKQLTVLGTSFANIFNYDKSSAQNADTSKQLAEYGVFAASATMLNGYTLTTDVSANYQKQHTVGNTG